MQGQDQEEPLSLPEPVSFPSDQSIIPSVLGAEKGQESDKCVCKLTGVLIYRHEEEEVR